MDYIKKDGILYKVTQEKVDTKALEKEKAQLEAELKFKEPTDEELVSFGRSMHQYYMQDTDNLQKRVKEIETILATK